jgi:EAL domain-containing protein (putative c-di-GMP-specific phosphodiesterase class I)
VQLLRQLGCRVAQGFFFGKPLPAEDFLRSLR